jgi:hypothetical protein
VLSDATYELILENFENDDDEIGSDINNTFAVRGTQTRGLLHGLFIHIVMYIYVCPRFSRLPTYSHDLRLSVSSFGLLYSPFFTRVYIYCRDTIDGISFNLKTSAVFTI